MCKAHHCCFGPSLSLSNSPLHSKSFPFRHAALHGCETRWLHPKSHRTGLLHARAWKLSEWEQAERCTGPEMSPVECRRWKRRSRFLAAESRAVLRTASRLPTAPPAHNPARQNKALTRAQVYMGLILCMRHFSLIMKKSKRVTTLKMPFKTKAQLRNCTCLDKH